MRLQVRDGGQRAPVSEGAERGLRGIHRSFRDERDQCRPDMDLDGRPGQFVADDVRGQVLGVNSR